MRIALLLVLAALAFAAPAVRADSLAVERSREREQSDLESQKRQELEDIRRQAAESRGAAGKLKAQESRVLGQLRKLERDLGLTRKRLHDLEHRRQSLDQQLDVTQQSLVRSRANLDAQRLKLGARLRAMYKFGAGRELEFLLSTRSFAELLARWDFLERVARQDRRLLGDIEDRRVQVEADSQKIVGNLRAIMANAQRTQRENKRLDVLRQQRAKSVEEIRTQREAYEAAAAELERTARSLQKLLAQLEERRKNEAAKAKAEGRNPQPYTGDFAKGKGALDWPVRGQLVGTFGPETHPRFHTTTLNNGIDIAAKEGAPVHAVAKGRVEFVNEDYGSFGKIVVVNHGDGYYTLYGHLADILVATGQEVLPGQTIGSVGDSGTALKGVALHFEVRKGGTALNPSDWLQ